MLEGLTKLNYSIRRKDFKEGKEGKREHSPEREEKQDSREKGAEKVSEGYLANMIPQTKQRQFNLDELELMVEELKGAALYQQSGISFQLIEKESGEMEIEAYSREDKVIQRLTPSQVADTLAQLGENNLTPQLVRGTLVNTSC